MLGVPLQILLMTSIVKGQGPEEAQIVVVRFSSFFTAVQRYDSSIFHHVMGQILATTDGMTSDFGHQESDVGDRTHDPFGIGTLLTSPL